MKNYKATLVYLILLCFNAVSCSKNNNKELLSDGIPLTQIPLSVKDANGIDLLNPNNEMHFKAENISFEQIQNNKSIVDTNTKIIKQPNSELYILLLKTNLNVINNKSKTIIHWATNLSDTLEVEFSENLFKAKKINLNNTTIWHHLQASSLPPTVIKQLN